MIKLQLSIFLALAALYQSYTLFDDPGSDNDNGYAFIDDILEGYRHDPNDEQESYKRSEEYDVKDEDTKSYIKMPGVSPQKVSIFTCS